MSLYRAGTKAFICLFVAYNITYIYLSICYKSEAHPGKVRVDLIVCLYLRF